MVEEVEKAAGTLSLEAANALVEEHLGWTQSIARAVARSWNMDWQLDGLDGAAMEALIFCARRFQPSRGVPFKGYARRRIHEASTEAARKSRVWKLGVGSETMQENLSRELSADLLQVFPELRAGLLPLGEDQGEGEDGTRGAIRQLLVGASMLAAKQASNAAPDDLLDYKKLIETAAKLEVVHQILLWQVYWEGESLRTVASTWATDELTVIREHKTLLLFLSKSIGRKGVLPVPKVRPSLKATALVTKKKTSVGPFARLVAGG